MRTVRHDRKSGKTKRLSVRTNGAQASNSSFSPSITPDGDFVAFHSTASDLVGGDDNDRIDVFRRGPLR